MTTDKAKTSDRTEVVVFLDDQPRSLYPQIEILGHYGIRTMIFSGILQFANFIQNPRVRDGDIKCFIIDSHLLKTENLASLGYPKIKVDPSSAGIAVATKFLSTHEQFSKTPKAILSAFVGPEAALNDPSLPFLSKANPREFEQYIRAILVESLAVPEFSFGAIVEPIGRQPDGTKIALMQPAYDEIIRRLMANPELMHQIEPRTWEEIIAGSYERAGFDEVILTPRSGDLGRDVVAIKKGFGTIKFIEQMKAYRPGHLVTADEVRALVGVLSLEQNASKAIFTTTSAFAPRLRDDRLLKPLLPTRLELVDKSALIARLSWMS